MFELCFCMVVVCGTFLGAKYMDLQAKRASIQGQVSLSTNKWLAVDTQKLLESGTPKKTKKRPKKSRSIQSEPIISNGANGHSYPHPGFDEP